MTGSETLLFDKMLEIKDDIKELAVVVHKSNGIKELVEDNARAIGGNTKLISDHLLEEDIKQKTKKKIKIDLKWIAIFVLAVSNLASAFLLR